MRNAVSFFGDLDEINLIKHKFHMVDLTEEAQFQYIDLSALDALCIEQYEYALRQFICMTSIR